MIERKIFLLHTSIANHFLGKIFLLVFPVESVEEFKVCDMHNSAKVDLII